MTAARVTAVLLSAMIALAVFTAAACAYRLVEEREWTMEVDRAPLRFALENVGGSIEVTGWDRDLVRVSARIRIRAISKGKARCIYDGMDFEVGRRPGNISIMVLVPRFTKDSLSGEGNTAVWIDYEVMVPFETDLDIGSVTGDIAVTGVEGGFRLVSEKGSIAILSGGGGGVIESGSGDVRCELVSFPVGASVRMKSGNGNVYLALPPGADAALSAKTRAGRVRVRFPMTKVEEKKRSRIIGVLGDGGGEIVLESAGGDVTMEEFEKDASRGGARRGE